MKMNRLFQTSFVACLAAMCFATVAEAQPPGGGGGGGGQRGGGQRGGGQRGGGQRGGQQRGGRQGGGTQMMSRAQLLRSEDVQEEIEIDDAQGATITAALEAFRDERDAARPDFSKIREMSDEEREAMFAKMRKDAEALTKKTDEMLSALLEADQIKRLDEIALQINARNGLAAVLKSEDMRKKLSFSDEQVTKLEAAEKENQEAQDKMREEMRASFSRGREEGGEAVDREKAFADMRKKGEEARAEGTKRIMAVLTDDQQTKLKEMQGEAFEVDMRSLMGGRGGRGGQGGRGGEGGGRGGQGGRGGEGGGRGGQGGRGDGGERRRPAADSDDPI